MIVIFKGFEINGKLVKKPIIQGGMGIGVSLSNLASAVAKEGGIGVISAAQPGYNNKDFYKSPLKMNLEALAYQIKTAKLKSNNGIIGMNIMCAGAQYEEFVRCCAENEADIIFSGAGLPIDLPKFVENSNTKIAPIVSSAKATKILLKRWDKRFNKTADIIIVEGKKAGGHLGFSMEELQDTSDNNQELLDIISIKNSYEDKYNKKIPIAFGGGVFYNHDVKHYINLGFDAVQVGTRFIATEECDASEEYKKRYLNLTKDDIIIIKSPVGMPGRAVKNIFLEKTKNERFPPKKCTNCMQKCDSRTTPYCISTALINAVSGNCDEGLMFCGENAHLIKEMTTVKNLMLELSDGI